MLIAEISNGKIVNVSIHGTWPKDHQNMKNLNKELLKDSRYMVVDETVAIGSSVEGDTITPPPEATQPTDPGAKFQAFRLALNESQSLPMDAKIGLAMLFASGSVETVKSYYKFMAANPNSYPWLTDAVQTAIKTTAKKFQVDFV